MRISRAVLLRLAGPVFALALALTGLPAYAQTAAEAAASMAEMMDGAGGGVTGDEVLTALQDAAAAGDTMALWQLGLMYESGEGVAQDKAKAFSYFSKIADDHADVAPKGVEAGIVADSFVKMGEYYRQGVPEAGVPKDEDYSNQLILYAASYFGDADAQYQVGQLYLDDKELGDNPLQSARWLSLAARKGHVGAQAQLGNILFNGQGIEANPLEGLMWLTVASRHAEGTADAGWVGDLLNAAMSVATPDQRAEAVTLADSLGAKFGGFADAGTPTAAVPATP